MCSIELLRSCDFESCEDFGFIRGRELENILVACAAIGDGTPITEIGGKLGAVGDTSNAGEVVARCASAILHGGELAGAGLHRMKTKCVFEQVDNTIMIGIEVVGCVATVRGGVEILHAPYFDRGKWSVEFDFINANAIDRSQGFQAEASRGNGGEAIQVAQVGIAHVAKIGDCGDGLPTGVGRGGIGVRDGSVLQGVSAVGAGGLCAVLIATEGDAVEEDGSGSEVDADEAVERACDPTILVAVEAIVHLGDGVRGDIDVVLGKGCFSKSEIRRHDAANGHRRRVGGGGDGNRKGGDGAVVEVVRGGDGDGGDSDGKQASAGVGIADRGGDATVVRGAGRRVKVNHSMLIPGEVGEVSIAGNDG